MTYTRILNEFKNSSINIISEDRLSEYINFCIDNNQKSHIKGKTSHHHILPQATTCFPEFKSLKSNSWNGTHLLHKDHYYAHWLLTEAIDNYSQLSAFCAMHNKDPKLGKINESDLISPDEFQEKMEKRSEKQRIWMKSDVGLESTRKMTETKNSKEWKETIGVISSQKKRKTLAIIQENGNTLATNLAIKSAKNMAIKQDNGLSIREMAEIKRQIYIESRGEEYKKNISKKQSDLKNSKEWKEAVGKEAKRKEQETKSSNEWKENVWKPAMDKRTALLNSKEWKETVGKVAAHKCSMTKLKGVRYDVFRNDELIYKLLTKPEVKRLTRVLMLATKETPVGNTRVSKISLNRLSKLHLIGMYVIERNINEN